MKNLRHLLLLPFLGILSCSPSKNTAGTTDTTTTFSKDAPALDAIKQEELKRDLFELASDEMRGKRAGTLDELRAAAWVAERAREAGLKPAGHDGTYFQFFPLQRTRIDESSEIKINGNNLEIWKDVWVRNPIETDIQQEVVWLNSVADTVADLNGKVVAMDLLPPAQLPEEWISLYTYRYASSAIRQQMTALRDRGVAAVILVADKTTEADLGFFGHSLEEGTYQLEGTSGRTNNSDIPVLLTRNQYAEDLKGNATVDIHLRKNNYTYPSVNVVAVAPGLHPDLKKEYILYSGHHDHDGVGSPVAGDSIYNGADDNASVTVAMLAIGRAWVEQPGKRSALFVWHGAEERGLFGSRYFVQNPTVPKESIVAVLNGDMIGRNEPGSAALLGAIPPHRNSLQLVEMAMAANEKVTNFNIDTSWDEADHQENWYFRSDHLPYAQAGIPAIFFTTLLHPDYHTPQDEAERIDLTKLTRMTKWMYATGWEIANDPEPPALDAD